MCIVYKNRCEDVKMHEKFTYLIKFSCITAPLFIYFFLSRQYAIRTLYIYCPIWKCIIILVAHLIGIYMAYFFLFEYRLLLIRPHNQCRELIHYAYLLSDQHTKGAHHTCTLIYFFLYLFV